MISALLFIPAIALTAYCAVPQRYPRCAARILATIGLIWTSLPYIDLGVAGFQDTIPPSLNETRWAPGPAFGEAAEETTI